MHIHYFDVLPLSDTITPHSPPPKKKHPPRNIIIYLCLGRQQCNGSGHERPDDERAHEEGDGPRGGAHLPHATPQGLQLDVIGNKTLSPQMKC